MKDALESFFGSWFTAVLAAFFLAWFSVSESFLGSIFSLCLFGVFFLVTMALYIDSSSHEGVKAFAFVFGVLMFSFSYLVGESSGYNNYILFFIVLGLFWIVHPIYRSDLITIEGDNQDATSKEAEKSRKAVPSLDISERPSNFSSMSSEVSEKIEEAKKSSKEVEFVDVKADGRKQQFIPHNEPEEIMVNICSIKPGMDEKIRELYDVEVESEDEEAVIYSGLPSLEEALSLIEASFEMLETNTEEVKFAVQPHGYTLTNFSDVSSSEDFETKIRDLDPDGFEELISKVWNSKGWNTEVTSSVRDRGIDVIAEKEDPYPRKLLIQAKKYSEGNKVTSEEVQRYSSLRRQENNVDEVLIVTTSSFTNDARERASDLNVKLINGNKLIEIVENYKEQSINLN